MERAIRELIVLITEIKQFEKFFPSMNNFVHVFREVMPIILVSQ
jgi:hypothetical protein